MKNSESKNFKVQGISFPKKPQILLWAKKEAKRNNKNLSRYVIDLILEDKQKKKGRRHV